MRAGFIFVDFPGVPARAPPQAQSFCAFGAAGAFLQRRTPYMAKLQPSVKTERRRCARAQPGVERERNPRTHPTMQPSSERAQEGRMAGLDAIVSAYSLRRTTAAPSAPPTRRAGVFHGGPYGVAPYESGLHYCRFSWGSRSRSTPGSVLLRLRRSVEFGHLWHAMSAALLLLGDFCGLD